MRTLKLGMVGVIGAVGIAALACDKPKETPMQPLPTLQAPTATAEPAGTTTTTKAIEPKNPVKEADADMKKVLAELDGLGGKPLATLTAAEARKQPTPTDAVKKLLEKEGKSTAPLEMATVENKKFQGAATQLDARIYTPKTSAKKPLPVVAYWHGGGFVIADIDVYDASPRALAKESEAIVVSLDYRRAPENKFPAAHDDAFAGYQWVLKNAASFGGDPKRIAVAGESAGGNLAANVAIMARDRGVHAPVHELLVYPVAQSTMTTKSYEQWSMAKPLDKANMGWFVENYTRSPADAKDVRIDLVDAKLAGLPKTTIVLAEIDPLRSDGEMLAENMKKAGVDVDEKTYDGVTHEFFGMGAVVGDAKDAESYAGGRLKSSFKK